MANKYTYDYLVNAVKGLAKGSHQYKAAVEKALAELGKEAVTPGAPLNKMITQ
jgi:hypothetical protein